MKRICYVWIATLAIVSYGCQQEGELVAPQPDSSSPEIQSVEHIRIVPAEEPGLMEKLHEMLYVDQSANGRTLNTHVGQVILETATKVTDHRSGTKRYSFLLQAPSPSLATRNLVLREGPDGTLTAYTITYMPDTTWVVETEGQMPKGEYTGRINFTTLDGFTFYYLDMIDGKGTLYGHKLRNDVNARVACNDGSGADGGGNYAGGDGYEPIGTGDFGEYPEPLPGTDPDPNGSSGGGSSGGSEEPIDREEDKGGTGDSGPVISLYPIEDGYKKEEAMRTACDAPEYPDKKVCEGDDALVEECAGEPIGMEEDTRSPYEYLADQWEEDICLEENFAANECVKGIWDIMREHNVGYETLTRFTGDQPVAELCLDIQPLGDSINGRTFNKGTEILIEVNNTKLS
ncbi:hypothetical protein AB9P05_23795 [Roseivirga sp. BDSF3-8]|uniref:hypothetical protein n=1 Tax=Roseivirga sp. BDSF3-8 TaxID=3241598 RepID=UPI003531CC33